jgi:hypothetical protein|tara:strand:- start:602 stop:1069 length:468 start_codon:yes stop_codon:yes gene_type:complete
MNFIYFICPDVPQYAKYCEGFYNYLTYGYKTWSRDRYVSSSPVDKSGKSRLLKTKNGPKFEEMRAGDFILDRIYKKVITSDCYEHSYMQITEEDINKSKLVVYMTSSTHPTRPPSYLNTTNNEVIVWKMSRIKKPSLGKYDLLEALVRKMVKPKN